MAGQSVKVCIALDPEDSPAASESPWAETTSEFGVVVLMNSPFFVDGLTLGDKVALERQKDGIFEVVRLVEKSGRAKLLAVLNDDQVGAPECKSVREVFLSLIDKLATDNSQLEACRETGGISIATGFNAMAVTIEADLAVLLDETRYAYLFTAIDALPFIEATFLSDFGSEDLNREHGIAFERYIPPDEGTSH